MNSAARPIHWRIRGGSAGPERATRFEWLGVRSARGGGWDAGNLHSYPGKKGAGLAGERAWTLRAERLSLVLLTVKSLVSHRVEGEQLDSASLF